MSGVDVAARACRSKLQAKMVVAGDGALHFPASPLRRPLPSTILSEYCSCAPVRLQLSFPFQAFFSLEGTQKALTRQVWAYHPSRQSLTSGNPEELAASS